MWFKLKALSFVRVMLTADIWGFIGSERGGRRRGEKRGGAGAQGKWSDCDA